MFRVYRGLRFIGFLEFIVAPKKLETGLRTISAGIPSI